RDRRKWLVIALRLALDPRGYRIAGTNSGVNDSRAESSCRAVFLQRSAVVAGLVEETAAHEHSSVTGDAVSQGRGNRRVLGVGSRIYGSTLRRWNQDVALGSGHVGRSLHVPTGNGRASPG